MEARWPLKLSLVLASLAAGLLLSELGLRALRGGAFPQLRLFEADPQLGVRLRPGGRARLLSRGGRVSRVVINPLGFRGPQPTGSGRRVLLLGDSQLFAYQVDEEEGTAARLRALGYKVLNTAVPSYGPPEYTELARRHLPDFAPDFLVYVAVLGNDWLEAQVPNRQRSTAQDGWLLRAGAAPLAASVAGDSQLGFLWQSLRRAPSLTRALPAHEPALLLERELSHWTVAPPGHRSRLGPSLRAVAELCRPPCRLVAGVLPLDVMVERAAWAKYSTPPRSLDGAAQLSAAFLAEALALGARVVDLDRALGAAAPGVFLADDDHLSPRGHAALAGALARAFAREDP